MPSKKRTVEDWFEEIDAALEYRRVHGLEDSWGKIEALYYNVHRSMSNDGPNILLSSGDAMLSTITVPDPKVLVEPRTPEAVAKSKILESLDNLLLQEMNVKEQIEKASLHAYLFGRGIIKIGYDSEFGFDPKFDLAGPGVTGSTLTQVDRTGSRRIEYDRLVIPGMPWVRAVPPHDFLVPWGTTDLDNVPWLAHRIIRHIDDIKADPKYSNKERLMPHLTMRDFVETYRSPIRQNQRTGSGTSLTKPQFVEMYEIHDRATGRVRVIVREQKRFLRDDINALQLENRLPFVSLAFTPISRTFWPTADAFYLLHAQLELSDIAVQRSKERRISVLKFLYDGDSISNEELSKMLSPDVGIAGRVRTGSKIGEAIMKFDNQPSQFLTLEEEHTRRNVREQLGFSRNQLGEFTGGRRTATEARTVDRASQLRMSRRQLSVKRAYERIIEIMNGIIFEYWTTPRYIEVIGSQKANEWRQVSGTQMKSRYAYEVIFTDAQEEKLRSFEALQLYQTLSQDPLVDPLALREFLTNQINDPAFERIFSADIRNALSTVRSGGGSVRQKDDRSGGGVSRSGNGQDPLNNLAGLLAGGRFGA